MGRRASDRWTSMVVALVIALVIAMVLAGAAGCTVDTAPRSPSAGAPSTTPTTPSSPTTTATTATGPPAALVDRLEVRTDTTSLPPYRRDAFGDGWAYDPASGCNTRERVLIDESLIDPEVDDRCRTTDGRWRAGYDGVETDDPADLQIDHLVALADAWRSGAWAWSDAQRIAFSNDLAHPEALVATTARTNQSKGDAAPDRWLPPDRAMWCGYASDWVAVKARWELSVTPAEKATLVQVLGGC